MPSVRRCLLFLLLPAAAFADGGAVQARRESGPFVVTVFTSPSSVVAGPLDISVLIQERATLAPILNAAVAIQLRQTRSSASISIPATREQAQNKLLYAAQVTLREEGVWRYTITISRSGRQSSIAGQFTAGPSHLALAAYWGYIALVPALIAVIAVHELLACRIFSQRARDS
jgi:hypothetical protein